jgi:hypothetical protein
VAKHQNIAEWHGKVLVDRDGEKIGKLEDVYVDVETDEPMFGTVKGSLAGKLLGCPFSHPLRVTDRFLVVGEPVEHALPHDRHDDLDRFGLPDMRSQGVVRMLDRTDEEDVLAHDGNVPLGGLPDR